MQYLNCLDGDEHHSFVWIGGKFVGNGFDLDEAKMADAKLMPIRGRPGHLRLPEGGGRESLGREAQVVHPVQRRDHHRLDPQWQLRLGAVGQRLLRC